MAYRDRTYVIFDGGTDIRSYNLMKAWKHNEHIDFDFYDSHDFRPIVNAENRQYIRSILRERMSKAKHVVVLIGEYTKYHTKYIEWEIELAKEKNLPIIVANLDGKNECNTTLCPLALKNIPCVLHVPFSPNKIKYALDNFPNYHKENHLKSRSHSLRYKNLG